MNHLNSWSTRSLRPMIIEPCYDPALLARLIPIATSEGFGHLNRLVTEWIKGTNRFDREGETLFFVKVAGEAVACGGVTRQRQSVGRIRRVYVDPAHRRRGLGKALVEALVHHSSGNFDELVLYTDNSNASRLYEGLGFLAEVPTSTPDFATHRLHLLVAKKALSQNGTGPSCSGLVQD